jgi:hypothetical protein
MLGNVVLDESGVVAARQDVGGVATELRELLAQLRQRGKVG